MTTRAPETSRGITTSWLPLTTPGPTLSPECLNAIYLDPANNASIQAFNPFYGQDVDTALQCLPAQQTTWWQQPDLSASTLWNLGPLACPNGYTKATTQSVNAISTILACCPSGYAYQTSGGIAKDGQAIECASVLTIGQVITPMSSGSEGWAPTTMTIEGPGTVIHGVQMNGWNFASSSTSTSSAASTVATQTPDPAASQTSSSVSSRSTSITSPTIIADEGLSSDAKAGIGIGVALGAIGIACLIVALLLCGRHHHTPRRQQDDFITPLEYYAHAPGAPVAQCQNFYQYWDVVSPQTPQQYHMKVFEISGESKPTPPVEMG